MIGCNNENCTIEWFHCKCLKISLDAVPKGNGTVQVVKNCQNLTDLKGKPNYYSDTLLTMLP